VPIQRHERENAKAGMRKVNRRHILTRFYPGRGRVFDSEGIKIEGEREKKEKHKGGKRRMREATFTIHLYTLFWEQFVVQNLNNLPIMTLNMRHRYCIICLY
jgi:hypothetical protein